MRLTLFRNSQIVFILLMIWVSPWFGILVALRLYVFVATVKPLWFHKSIRKWFFRLVFKQYLIQTISKHVPLLAYPTLIEVELSNTYQDKYVELGNDKFIDWALEQVTAKVERIGNMVDGLMDDEEEEPLDPETQALMKQAMSREYRSIADRANNEEFERRYNDIQQERLIKEVRQMLGTDKDLDEQL